MAFSPENKPFKNSVFLLQSVCVYMCVCACVGGVGQVVGKWEALFLSLENYSCKKEGMGLRWNGGSFKMRQKGRPWTPRRLLSSLPGPWVPLGEDSLFELLCTRIRSLLRKPSWGWRGEGGKKPTWFSSAEWAICFKMRWEVAQRC